ncbi:MAG: DUF1800 domain-containing protein [Verrucomicrobia bacterium]|nr:MAG: DUF1800 domain-containing protein [Verrucomicrobiota bacterium]
MNMLAQLPASLWNDETAAHLLNRARFGATPAEIDSARKKGLVAMVREFVDVRADAGNVPPPAWAKPRNIRAARMALKAAKERGENFRETARQFRVMEGDEILDLRRWWLERMMNSPAPLLEKMTLFWHGHFATSVQKVKDGYWMWLQNDTLRRNALGNFATLVKAISRDPAMMIYLDLQQNREAHPNENWARELMELFTVGIGNYSEDDIRAAARAFTGYRIDMTTQQFRFARMEQDLGTKKFMGHTGPLNGDNVIDILVRQPACSRFISRKLWRFFVEDEPSQEIVDAIASRIRAHNFEMRPVLREIFSSAEFYSDRAMGTQIKSPLQYIVQTSKLLETQLPSPIVVQNAMRQMGQILFAPPNVKGWDGGKDWITTSTLLFRYNFANYLISGDAMLPAGQAARAKPQDAGLRQSVQRRQLAQQIKREPIDVSKFVPDPLRDKPRQLVELLSGRFFRTRLAEKEINTFVQFLESRKLDTSDATMRELVHLMMSTPQFQLA